MVLDTTADVDEIDGVSDRNGDRRPAANADEQEVTNARLGNADAVFSDVFEPSTAGDSCPSHSVAEGKEVVLLADPANGGIVYIGPVGGATTPLTGGNGVTMQVTNTDLLEAKASEAGQTLHLLGEEGT